ncbi:MAG TPA: glycosyltransferase 87 family protein, partial [Gemmataceae bacterium]|nr:glycosyltransferase 87 family protein [Gemmataceae bacterium]
MWKRTHATLGVASSSSLRLALIVWLILGIAVSVRTMVRPGSHTVFPIFAASAENWWGNRPLYELYAGLDRFRYPPVFALFVTPFSALGLTTGGILWGWASIAVFVAGLWRYLRDVVPSEWTRQRMAVFLILGALGALRGLWNAQSNALIAGLILLGSAAL